MRNVERTILVAVLLAVVVSGQVPTRGSGPQGLLGWDADPVVIPGAQLRSLKSVAIDRIVGFRLLNGWEQIPIQIDERKYADYAGLYGKTPCGYGLRVYADPDTYAGPDMNPGFDADDELAFMAKDAGILAPSAAGAPVGVLANSRVEIQLRDPLDDGVGYVYLFASDGSLAQSAGKDYVTYHFRLLRGPFLSSYNRGQGYNPEDSEVRTSAYRTHFSDRWIRDELQVFAGGATGVDILDRHKIGRDPGNCSRNENTASEGGGVFVTNKDGCVRAIRSYMGFNSAPYVQRQHFFYEQGQRICTYIRAHDTVADFRDLYDYSPAASGMRYFNDLNLTGVLIDGIPDTVNHGQINWEMVTGVQGTIVICHSLETDIPNFKTHSFYGDDATPDLVQCTGDQYQYGTSGLDFDPASFTDPVLYPTFYSSLAFHRTNYYGSPSQTIDTAVLHHQHSITPLEVKAVALTPPTPIFVDNDAVHDPAANDPRVSDPLENGSPEHPFDTIQEALDYALEGETVIVLDGAYTGAGNHDLDFNGKAITLRSQNGPSGCIIDGQGLHCGFVFQSDERQDSVLGGFTITNTVAERGAGVSCVGGSKPTISNCIFRGNSALGPASRMPRAYGGAIYCQASNPRIASCTFHGNSAKTQGGAVYCEGSAPTIINCIFWGNRPDGVYGSGLTVTYSDIQGGWKGEGNIDRDPLFADAARGDCHLQSQGGRWDPMGKRWVIDSAMSPCIDAGDPDSEVGNEPKPNGDRIDMGAYGGSVEASKSR